LSLCSNYGTLQVVRTVAQSDLIVTVQ